MSPVVPLKKGILTVAQLLADNELSIPEYQRPYKWTGTHISQLFADIDLHKDKKAYRLGTVVFHRHNGKRYIVDGQQRTLSLMLAAHALIETRTPEEAPNPILRKDLQETLKSLPGKMIDPAFTNLTSQTNLHGVVSENGK